MSITEGVKKMSKKENIPYRPVFGASRDMKIECIESGFLCSWWDRVECKMFFPTLKDLIDFLPTYYEPWETKDE